MTTKLASLEEQAWRARDGLSSRRARDRQRAVRQVAALEREINRCKPRPPFETRDNGAHEYYETDSYLVLRNHGSAIWCGMLKHGGSYSVVTSGFDARRVLRATERAAAEAAASRRSPQ